MFYSTLLYNHKTIFSRTLYAVLGNRFTQNPASLSSPHQYSYEYVDNAANYSPALISSPGGGTPSVCMTLFSPVARIVKSKITL